MCFSVMTKVPGPLSAQALINLLFVLVLCAYKCLMFPGISFLDFIPSVLNFCIIGGYYNK